MKFYEFGEKHLPHVMLIHGEESHEADTSYWYGSKEMKCIKESAYRFKSFAPKCEVTELNGYRHSEISAYHPEEWVQKATEFWLKESSSQDLTHNTKVP